MLTDISISAGAVMVKYWMVYNYQNSWVNLGAGNNLLWVSLNVLRLNVLQLHTNDGWNPGFTARKRQSSHRLLQYSQDFTNWVFEAVILLKGWLLWSGIGKPVAIPLQAFSPQLMNWKQHLLSGLLLWKKHEDKNTLVKVGIYMELLLAFALLHSYSR